MAKNGNTNGNNSGNNNGGTNSYTRDVKVKINASTQEAVRAVRELERQIKLINKLADQGTNFQNGFLSHKQVRLYKQVMKEIEQNYQKHLQKLQSLENEYNSKKKSAQQELAKRQQQLSNAQGNNKWGNVSSPKIQNYYRTKVNEAQSKVQETDSLKADLDALKTILNRMSNEKQNSSTAAGKVNQLHEVNPTAYNTMRGIQGFLAQAGVVTSFGALGGYLNRGKNSLRYEELQAAQLGQKMGTYGGDDAGLRLDFVKIGEKNQYSAYETQQVARRLLLGGTNGSAEDLGKDTQTAQSFGRAYAIDPNEMASEASLLKKMGAIKDGDMQKFANLIGGAVAKNSMRGREEEMLRATTSLVNQASYQLAEVTDKQVGNIVGLQTALGDAVPTLKGQRGAEVLSTMDNAIKGGGNSLDILMGKGTSYVGLEGVRQLEYMKEEGIANPKNLQSILQNVKRTGATKSVQEFILKENLGLTLHQQEAMDKAGLMDRISNGNFNVTDEDQQALRSAGESDLADRLKDWNKTTTKDWLNNEAQDTKIRNATAKPIDRIGKAIGGLWHSLPDPLQSGLIYGAGIGGGILSGTWMGARTMGRMADFFTKAGGANIGQAMAGQRGAGLGGIFRAMGSKLGGFGTTLTGLAGSATGGLASLGIGLGSGASTIAGAATAGMSSLLGGVLGVAGAGAGVVDIAKSFSAKDKEEASLKRWQGGTKIGMVGAGAAGGAALGSIVPVIGTGIGALVGAGVGGVMALTKGNQVGKSLSGQGNVQAVAPTAVPGVSAGTSDSAKTLTVNTLNVQDKNFADFLESKTSNKTTTGKAPVATFMTATNGSTLTMPAEHTIKITIDGEIKNMTQANQKDVKDSIVDYFSGLMNNISGTINMAKNFRIGG